MNEKKFVLYVQNKKNSANSGYVNEECQLVETLKDAAVLTDREWRLMCRAFQEQWHIVAMEIVWGEISKLNMNKSVYEDYSVEEREPQEHTMDPLCYTCRCQDTTSCTTSGVVCLVGSDVKDGKCSLYIKRR